MHCTFKCVVKMLECAPERRVSDSAFRDKAVNVKVPLKAAAESMEDTDKIMVKREQFWNLQSRAVIFLQKNVSMRMTVYFPFAIIEKAYQYMQGEEGIFRQDISSEPCDEKV